MIIDLGAADLRVAETGVEGLPCMGAIKWRGEERGEGCISDSESRQSEMGLCVYVEPSV
jgi:hypothetical protein